MFEFFELVMFGALAVVSGVALFKAENKPRRVKPVVKYDRIRRQALEDSWAAVDVDGEWL